MKIKFILTLVMALLVGGCQTPSNQLNKVHLGMSEADVIKILGPPASIADNHDGKTLYYTLREDWAGATLAQYSVKLIDGKVDYYGRDGGSSRTVTPMPVVVPVTH